MTADMTHAHVRSDMVYEVSLLDAGDYGFKSLVNARRGPAPVRYFLNDQYLLSTGDRISTVVADLLDVACSIMYADRKFRRSRQKDSWTQNLGWMRTFKLTLGVREPDRWNEPVIKRALEGLLGWLTEDAWHLTFALQPNPVRRLSDAQSGLPFRAMPGKVVLFSGGLDSLAGVGALLQEDPSSTIYLMSAASPRMDTPAKIASRIREIYPQVELATFPFHLVHTDRHDQRADDASQRARGFLFFAFAAAVAASTGSLRIIGCENGIGAINLPMNWCQLGTQNTRAMHPRTLAETQQFLGLIGLPKLRLELPFLWKTKGELCRTLAETQLRNLTKLTVSCDNFPDHTVPRRDPDIEIHCGECTSCLLRRLAVANAGLEEPDAPPLRYKLDLCHPLVGVKTAPHEHLKYMLDQVSTLREATDPEAPTGMLLREFPELTEVASAVSMAPERFALASQLDHNDIFGRLFDLYRWYVEEWRNFPYSLAFR
jgi:7-cyano-7-deazaguanine synthase in queuosine biosynthesis